jgi:hypothetical protein
VIGDDQKFKTEQGNKIMIEGIDADKITAWFENAVPELKAPLT